MSRVQHPGHYISMSQKEQREDFFGETTFCDSVIFAWNNFSLHPYPYPIVNTGYVNPC